MKLKTGIFIGLGVVVAGLVATPFLLPLDVYRAQLERAASTAIGRDVRIRGPIKLTVYPELGISLSDVSIANVPGGKDPEMLSAESVLVGAELMPLLSRRLEVTEVVLQKPVAHLEMSRNGVANWRLGDMGAPAPKPAAPAQGAPAADAASNFSMRDVRINDGELSYFDGRSNSTEAFKAISIHLNMPRGNGRNAPLNLDGNVTYNGQPLKISGAVEKLDALLNARPTGLSVGVASNMVNAEFMGSVGTDGRISGALKLGAHSVRSLAAWLGHPMPPGNGFGLMAMEGQFSVRDGVYTLQHTHLAFDSMSLNTDLIIDANPDVPMLKGNVTIDKLNVLPYLAPGTSEDTVKAVKAKAANPGAPLEFGWLKTADADVTLVLGGLVVPDFKLDHAIVNANLKGGVLKADLSSVSAYGGTGKGSFAVDASGAIPTFKETLDIAGFKAQPLLNDLIGVNRINSAGALRLDLTSRGTSEDAIVKGLNGKGSVKFTDGTLSGVDLAAVARLLQSVLTTEVLTGAVGDNAKTQFGSMGGNFTVQNGVLKTTDLALVSDAVELNATGTADLSAHQLDFHFEPKAKKGIPGLKIVDIGVPFNVKGPWDHPNYSPDAGGIAKNVVNKLEKGATLPIDVLRDPGGALNSLFGGGKSK